MARGPETWLLPDAVFDGVAVRRERVLSVLGARSGRLLPLADLPDGIKPVRVKGLVTAGFLDLQVNGGGDALLNNDPTAAAVRVMAAAHRRFGTVGILPTVITDAPEVLERAVQAAVDAQGEPGILGLHIEGPHLSLARRGTHQAAWVRPLDEATMAHVRRLRQAGVFVMITLAPESVRPGQVAALVAMGAVVSIGHSDAAAEDVRAVLNEGANCFTHLFNAMSPMLNRAPGVTGACINSQAFAGIICDGHHVADEMVGLAVRARPVAGRMFLVSDAMSTVGGSDRFTLYGQELHLSGGRLVNAEGSLAGAHVTMAEGFQRLITKVGVAPDLALDMAVAAPARLLGRPGLAGLEDRDLSDLLVLGADWSVQGGVADLLQGPRQT